MGAKILLVGDIHLGRRPARLPADLGEWDLDPALFTPAAAWSATVDLALREEVDAVVLAGDVVQEDNARFEAFGRLADGVSRLVDRGIQVWAVSGNHDVEALPRLVDLIPGFRLLGRGGRWELATLHRDGQPLVHFLGWSFPEPRFGSSPLAGRNRPEPPRDGRPCFGVLHADLDGHDSAYAPVSRAELDGVPVDGWFLGHVHKPSDLSGPRPVGYLGSLVGLDPSETGPHGPWLLHAGREKPELRHVPLAPLRWQEVEIDVSGWKSLEHLLPEVERALESLHRSLAPEAGALRAVGCRLRWTGITPLRRDLRAVSVSPEIESLRRLWDPILYFIDRAEDRTRPALDLPAIAREQHPAGLLARRLLALVNDGPEAAELIHRARGRLEQVGAEATWSSLEPLRLDDERVRTLLIETGTEAIEELLSQVGSESDPGGAP